MAPMLGWFGDLGRLSWGLVYWNWRKSLFRIRGASGLAPCQHPSDPGQAGKASCEACGGWRSKERFRVMCPLLAVNASGRRVCSVAAADVRPFWGRAAAFYLGFAGAVAIMAVGSVFTTFRLIGYHVPLYAVAWPPAWHRIQQARADYFLRLAARTLESGDVRQSYLALNQVYALDPDNAPAALLLAQFSQLGNPDYSDEIYGRLMRMSVGNHEEIAQSWFRALIARGDMPAVAGLSSHMLLEGSRQYAAWTQALLFAEAMSQDFGETDRLLAASGGVPAESRSVLEVARSMRKGTDGERLGLLELYLGGASTPLEVRYSLGRMIRLGGARQVAALLEGPGKIALSAYDRESLKLDAYASLGWSALDRREIGYLLDQGTTAPTVVLVAAHLVRYRDPETAARVFDLLGASPLAPTQANLPGHLSLLCMAGVNDLGGPLRAQADVVASITGGAFPAWMRLRDFFESASPGKNPASVLPALPQLPLEVTYGMLEHYGTGGTARPPGVPQG